MTASDEWNNVLPTSYEPMKLSMDRAAEPKTVKRVMKACYGTEAADVIAALVHELCMGRERERYFAGLLKEIEEEQDDRRRKAMEGQAGNSLQERSCK